MTNKKKKGPVTVGNPGEAAAEPDRRSPIEKLAERQDQLIVDLINDTKLAEGYVVLKRRAVGETEFGHLAEIAASVFSEENVKKIYGGGDYKAQFHSAARKFAGGATFKIDYSIPPKFPGADKSEDRPDNRTPEIISAITAAMKTNTPAGPDPLTLELIKMQGQLLIAMAGKPQAPATDPALASVLAELVREVRDLKTARGGGGGDSFQRTLENARALMELTGGGGDDGGAPDKPDRVSELIRAFGPAGAALLQRMLGVAAQAPDPALLPAGMVARPMLTDGNGAQPAAVNPQQVSAAPNMQLLDLFLPEFRRLAILAAEKDRSAFDWVDTKLDEIDGKYHDAIFQLANSEDWFARIFKGDPAANARVAWMLEMRNAILVRMLVADLKTCARTMNPPPEPAKYAAAVLDRMSVSFHDELWNLLEPQTWHRIFAPLVAGSWIDQMRTAFEKELGEDESDTAAAAKALSATTDAGSSSTPGSAAPPKPAETPAPRVVSDVAAGKPAARVPSGKKPAQPKPKAR